MLEVKQSIEDEGSYQCQSKQLMMRLNMHAN
jgi:hypothetical protein